MIFNCFLTDDLPSYILDDHKRCAAHQKINVNYRLFPATDDYEKIYKAHGNYLNELMEKASVNETICFIDIDALPWNAGLLSDIYSWTRKNKSFSGNAQNISHTKLKNQIYAAASMLMIHKQAYLDLGAPDLSWGYDLNGEQIDTAQNLTIKANSSGFTYRLLYPLGFDDTDKCYDLGGFGQYGTGTLYPGTWHYFRISALKNKDKPPSLWSQRVKSIIDGESIDPLVGSQYFVSKKSLFTSRIKKIFKF